MRQTIVLPNGDCIPILAPALEPARGTLLVLNEGKSLHSPPSPFSAEKYGKLFQPQHWRTELFQILRPAVENGYAAAVISFPEYNDNIPDILNALKTFHDMPEPPSPEILVFAEGNLAVETLKAAARMEAEQNYRFIVKGIDEDSPWEENRLGALLPQCPFPVMVLPDDSKTDIPTILFTSTVD